MRSSQQFEPTLSGRVQLSKPVRLCTLFLTLSNGSTMASPAVLACKAPVHPAGRLCQQHTISKLVGTPILNIDTGKRLAQDLMLPGFGACMETAKFTARQRKRARLSTNTLRVAQPHSQALETCECWLFRMVPHSLQAPRREGVCDGTSDRDSVARRSRMSDVPSQVSPAALINEQKLGASRLDARTWCRSSRECVNLPR